MFTANEYFNLAKEKFDTTHGVDVRRLGKGLYALTWAIEKELSDLRAKVEELEKQMPPRHED